jgi:hypothetical protein
MQIPNPKPAIYNFEVTTMYNIPQKIDIHTKTEKFMRTVRPTAQPIYKPVPKPHKDQSYFHPGPHEIRNDQNKYKNIPHKDYLPSYTPPYYTIEETGWTNVRHKDIFTKYY